MTAPVATCEVHPSVLVHAPTPHAQQFHHVIPRDWQRGGWAPPTAPFPGVYVAFGVHEQLWDARGVEVPPTCHLNVHAWLVAVMHELAVMTLPDPPNSDDISHAAGRVAHAAQITTRSHRNAFAMAELSCAMQAPMRYAAAGGDVRTLIAAGQWGAA